MLSTQDAAMIGQLPVMTEMIIVYISIAADIWFDPSHFVTAIIFYWRCKTLTTYKVLPLRLHLFNHTYFVT